MEQLQCYNKGCGQKFNPKANVEGKLQWHNWKRTTHGVKVKLTRSLPIKKPCRRDSQIVIRMDLTANDLQQSLRGHKKGVGKPDFDLKRYRKLNMLKRVGGEKQIKQVWAHVKKQVWEWFMEQGLKGDKEQEHECCMEWKHSIEQEWECNNSSGWEFSMMQVVKYDMEQTEKCSTEWDNITEQTDNREIELMNIDILTEEDMKIQGLSDLFNEMSLDRPILSHFLKQTDLAIDKVSTPTTKLNIKKDTRHSQDEWVWADKILFHNLNITEKCILKSKQWLNESIIDSSMNLLQYQFPDLDGFQPCHQLNFRKHRKQFIQIINRSLTDGGSHWLTVSNINCIENTIKIYDSAYDDLPYEQAMVVASLVTTRENNLQVLYPSVALQMNGYDCGLYAIANATALAFGIDPITQVYTPGLMREHLIKCLEQRHLKPIPGISRRNEKKLKNKIDLCTCTSWNVLGMSNIDHIFNNIDVDTK